MSGYALPIKNLITEFSKFPGIGEKTAARLANHVLRSPEEEVRAFTESLLAVKRRIRFCSACFNLAEGELCDICADHRRDSSLICVVEDPDALIALEASGEYHGVYHVLHGAISPLDGIGPDRLKIAELLERVTRQPVAEVIIATNPDTSGESTALLIARLLRERDVKVSRIAFGVPMGGDLRYTDKMTLAKSLEFRRNA
jgi:recombination protein RecR